MNSMPSLSVNEIMKRRQRFLFEAYLTYYPDDPLALKQANMQYVLGLDGRRYLDAFASVVTISVGHCHPEVVEAVQRQLTESWHFTTLFPETNLVCAAERLADLAPDGLNRSFWMNSGSEANDFAAHAAMRATGRTGLLALRHSFHGRTGTASALTFQGTWRNVPPYKNDVASAPNPYHFRRPKGMSRDDFLRWCLTETKQTIDHTFGNNLAAMWVEPIQGNGGVITAPPWYYDELIRMVHQAGGLFVADEVQTGVGRTGKMWGCSDWTETPDLMVLAKGLGNGYPVSAVVGTDAVSASFRELAHFNTFGGNPIATLVAHTVLGIIARHETQANIRGRGRELGAGLKALVEKHPMAGDARGQGLMRGLEIVDPKTGNPAAATTKRIMRLCRDHGVLLGSGGVDHNVIRIKPPYCITKDDTKNILEAIDTALTTVENEQ